MKVMIIATMELPEGTEPTTCAERVSQALNIPGLEHPAQITVLQKGPGQSLKEQMPGVFSDAGTPEAKATIPYQEKAVLQTSTAGEYMDVVGNDGRVLASFDKPMVRRVWGEMNR